MMLWTLTLIAISSGIFDYSVHTIQFPMTTKEACIAAGKDMLKTSKGVALVCVGSEKGEVIRVSEQ
jgi:hypothetical protein